MSLKVECCVCGKKETFGDVKDISYAKWRILSWQLHRGGIWMAKIKTQAYLDRLFNRYGEEGLKKYGE